MTVATKFNIGDFVCFFNNKKGKLEFGNIKSIEIYQHKSEEKVWRISLPG